MDSSAKPISLFKFFQACNSNSSSSYSHLSLTKLHMERVIALILFPVSLVPQCYMVAETIELKILNYKKKKKNCMSNLQRRIWSI